MSLGPGFPRLDARPAYDRYPHLRLGKPSIPTQIRQANISSNTSIIDVVMKATRWSYVCNAIDILTGRRDEEYPYEAAIALFVIKAWLSGSVPLLFAIKNAPALFCSMVLSEEINDARQRKEFRHKSSLNLFNRAVDNPDLTRTMNSAFLRMNVIEFLLKTTWRPNRYGIIDKKNKSEIERLNELTAYRLRLGKDYNFGVNDAALLLGEMRKEKSWKSTTVKDIRRRWKKKEAFLFIGRMQEVSSVVSFDDLAIRELLHSIEADAKNYQRNTNYFANVKGVIAQLTPEISKELEKDERWRTIEPTTIALASINDDERRKIKQLLITATPRRSADETKAARRQRPWSK